MHQVRSKSSETFWIGYATFVGARWENASQATSSPRLRSNYFSNTHFLIRRGHGPAVQTGVSGSVGATQVLHSQRRGRMVSFRYRLRPRRSWPTCVLLERKVFGECLQLNEHAESMKNVLNPCSVAEEVSLAPLANLKKSTLSLLSLVRLNRN